MAEENKIKTAEKRPGGLSDYQKMQIRKLGLSEDNFDISKVGDKALGFDLIEKLFNSKNQKLRDGDFEKHDEHDPYYLYIAALKNGMFPAGGKYADKFLLALEGTPHQKAAAVEILENNSGSQLSSAKFAKCLKQLEEAEQKDAQVNPDEASTDIFSRISSITKTADSSADTKEKVSGEVKLEEEKMQREVPTFGAWELDLLPESFVKSFNSKVEKFNRLSPEYFEEVRNAIPVGDELNELELEKISLTSSLENPSLGAQESAKLTKELESLEIKISKLKAEVLKRENEISRLGNRLETAKFEMRAEEEKIKDYLCKKMDEFWKFKNFANTSGVAIFDKTSVNVWAVNQSADSSNELGGIEVGADGKAKKIFKKGIEIKKIHFSETEKTESDSAGTMVVEYEEDGVPIVSNSRNFYDKLNALEAHEDIADIDELNFEIAKNCNFKGIEKGDKFKAESVAETLNEVSDTEKYEPEEFAIEEIDEKNKLVVLDRPVFTLKRQALGLSIPNTLYFDRTAKTLSFGAFKKLVLQRKFNRVKTKADTTAKIAQGVLDYKQRLDEKMAKAFKKPASASPSKKSTCTLPKVGEKKKMDFFDDQTGETRLVDVENLGPDENGEEQYDIIIDRTEEKSPFGEEQKKLRKLHAMGVVKEAPETDLPKVPVKPKIERRRLVTSAPKHPMFKLSNIPKESSDVQVQQGALTDPLADPDDMAVLEQMNQGGGAPTAAHSTAHDEPPKDSDYKPPEKYKKEALPYDEVHKVAGKNNVKVDVEQRSFLGSLWRNTHLMSCDDVFELGKAAWEYHHRKWERDQKERFSIVGKELPYIDREMARIYNSVEGEEVETFKHAMAEKGVDEILLILETTGNMDEFKAALMDLSSRGQMRWDDIEIWKNLNRIPMLKHQFVIPIPANGDPYTLVSEDGKTGFDYLQPAIDSLWGENTYNGLYSQNTSSFTSKEKGWYEKGSELENIPGGHAKYLSKLLARHKSGKGFVDPQEYEGLILHAIENGKSDMNAKFYFMVEGLTAINHTTGKTILSWDRIAHINSTLLPKFPILEYMTKSVMRKGKDGKPGKAYKFTKDDYEEWAHLFDTDESGHYMHDNCKPTAAVSKFLWEYVIPSDETQDRTNKAIRHPENLDHDDMYAYLPITEEQVIEDACGNISGNKKGFTVEGYCNAFPGFSEYMKTMANSGNKNKLMEAIKSYVRFQGIMTSQYKKEKDTNLQRLGRTTLNNPPIVMPGYPTKIFMEELNAVVKKIIAEYNDPLLNEYADKIFNWKVGSIKTDPAELKKQRFIDDAFAAFGDRLAFVVKKTDEGAAMTNIIKNAHLIGMTDTYLSSEEKDLRKAEIERKKSAIQSEYSLRE